MPAFGKVYAQPLYATNETGPDGAKHNLVLVATSTDQVYAFDDVTRALMWHRDFTNAAAGGRQQLWSDMGCSDVNPNIGISGTPVIDRALDRMYLVAATMENGIPYQRLRAVSLSTGAEISTTPVTGTVALAPGDSASVNPLTNFNRSALLEGNGNIYVTLSSHCDSGSKTTHGWAIAYNATTLAQTGSLAGTFNGTTDFAMSVLTLPGNLNLGAASYFTPATAAANSSKDADFGAGGVMLLPDQTAGPAHPLIQGGKCGSAGCLKIHPQSRRDGRPADGRHWCGLQIQYGWSNVRRSRLLPGWRR